MKKETVIDRIAKAEEKLAKKSATIEKKTALIAKKEAQCKKLGFEASELRNDRMTNDEKHNEAMWIAFDIEHLEEDIERLTEEVAETANKLVEYKAELKSIEEKENSRNVQVIIDFLNNWKETVKAYYMEAVAEYTEALKEVKRLYSEADEGYAEAKKEFDKNLHGTFELQTKPTGNWKGEITGWRKVKVKVADGKWEFASRYLGIGIEEASAALDKDLAYDAQCKYDDIIERTNSIVGEITDASMLKCNAKGNLDGFIAGTRGKAIVQTIGAGGYNIQCFHFRTLINKVA